MSIYGYGSRFGHRELAPEAKGADKQSIFEFTTKALLPIGLGILASMQDEGSRFWGFFLVTTLAICASFYGTIISTARSAIKKRSELRSARGKYPVFLQLVSRFGEFVDPRRQTFEEIVRREICENNNTPYAQLGVARGQIFADVWAHLNKKHAEKPASVSDFLNSVDEFLSLVNNYSRYCLDPVFESLPNELRNELRPSSRTELEAFRERFIGFRDKLEDFVRDVSRSLPAGRSAEYYVARPKPLFQPELPRVASK